MKKARLTSIFMLSLLIVSNLVLPARVFAEEANANTSGKEVLSSIFATEESLNEHGLSLKQFTGFQQKSSDFYKILDAILSSMDRDMPLTEEQKKEAEKKLEKARKISDKWVYASQMAKENMQRDGNAKDVNKETLYMYLSHYVDIRTGVLDTVNPNISNDGYFSAWIVNDDRRAYDQYVSKALSGEKTFTAVKAVKSFIDNVTPSDDAEKLDKIKSSFFRTIYFASSLMLRDEQRRKLLDDVEALKTAWNNSDDPKAVVAALEQSFELEGYEESVKGTLKSLLLHTITAFTIGDPEIIKDLVVGGGEFLAYAAKDLYDKALWISLIQYNNLRVSKRIMRYYGFDF